MQQFQNELKKRGIDFALFFNNDMKPDANLFYFSGYKGAGALIIPKKKRPFLVAPLMEYERARKSGLKVYKWKKRVRLFRLLKDKIRNAKKIGIDMNSFSVNNYKELKRNFKIKIDDVSAVCSEARTIKTKNEMALLKKSCSIASKIMEKTIDSIIKKLKTETDVANFINLEAKKYGCEMAFPPIVASGKASSMPHYEPKKIKLRKGFCIIDFGVRYKGYCSDITRTIFLGKPNKIQIEMYELLLKSQVETINSIRLNISAEGIYKSLRNRLGKYKKNFIHGLGHGIGIDVHELPNLTDKSKDAIKKGMVFTVEPGIYFPGKFGIRIEDDILMMEMPIILTDTSKKLVIR